LDSEQIMQIFGLVALGTFIAWILVCINRARLSKL